MRASCPHGAAGTPHKAQGAEWPSVEVCARGLFGAGRGGRTEAGQPLRKRLAYVAITRAQDRLIWVTRNMLAKPTQPLSVADLQSAPIPMILEAEQNAPSSLG